MSTPGLAGRFFGGAALVALLGCNDNSFFIGEKSPPVAPAPGTVQGRVCDPSGRTWLADALVYTHLFDREGKLYETREAYSDRDGYWTIDELPADYSYTFYVQYGDQVLDSPTTWVGPGDFVELDEPDCFDPLQINVAIITGDYDQFDEVLGNMGFANYVLIDGMDQAVVSSFLLDAEAMSQYDIIFFNGGHLEEDIIYDTDASDTAAVHTQIRTNIDAYVNDGGVVYGSDWAYDTIEGIWPDRIEWVGDDTLPNDAQTGEYDSVSATITDEAMAAWLGTNTLRVEYDLPVWPPIESTAGSVTSHVRGSVSYRSGTETFALADVPLLVSFTSGEGRVVFSTFRMARNGSEDVTLILQYMMYNL